MQSNKPEHILARQFADVWLKPSADELIKVIHSETILYQPHLPPLHGREAAYQEFKRFMDWVPGFYGVVDRYEGDNNLVFIEWQMKFPIGKKVISIRAVDRISIQEGLIKERAVYFNTLPLIKAILGNPGGWRKYLRYRFAKRI